VYILPLIELQKGESVHTLVGQGLGEARPLMDPVEVLNRFIGYGAQGAHVVDVDHAKDPARDNDKKLADLIEHTVVPIVAGGGVRSLKRIQELLDTGARRVLVGSFGVKNPAWLKEAALIFGDRLIACIDVRGDDLLVEGRTQTAETSLASFLGRVDDLKLESLHVSYVGKNGSGIQLMESLSGQIKTPLTYAGPVSGGNDLQRLERAGVRGAVLGAEIYDGRLPFTPLAKAYRVR